MKSREEQYPLLLFFVGGDRTHQQENRRCFRGRFESITTGASSVMNQWPSYVSSCWVTTIVFGLSLLMATLMLMALIGPNSPPLRLPRCANTFSPDNKTVHLIKDSPKWTSRQFQLLDAISGSYPDFKIRVFGMHPSHKSDFLGFFEGGNRSVESIIFKAIFGAGEEQTIEDFAARHSNVEIAHRTYRKLFENTPLNHKWRWMTPKLRAFSARVIQLWEFGGVSYDLSPQIDVNSSVYYDVDNLVRGGLKRFENLSDSVVSVDSVGVHMESKVPCHSFFGRIIMILKNSSGYISVAKVLKDSMKMYCRMGALDAKFCPFFESNITI